MSSKKILLMGAGRSASSLIRYLLEQALTENWEISVGDVSLDMAVEKTKNLPGSRAIAFDVTNEKQRTEEINNADLVISLLPPALHILAAKECVKLKKSLVTASYISDEIRALDAEAKKSGVLIMNECGLDPGIDHMSAMQIIHRLQAEGVELLSFKSYTGGLIAPESNDNPWGYKFTWNPRNVIVAGQGTAKYMEHNSYKYIPYIRLFKQTESIDIAGHGRFEGYANRDSLAYRHHYGLDHISTLLRGTLRYHGFCAAWNVFVNLGITDDTYIMEGSDKMTYADFIRSFIPGSKTNNDLLTDLSAFSGYDKEADVMQKIKWTGILDHEPIGLPESSPAKILQHLLEKKWLLKPGDKDMIMMLHVFNYMLGGKKHELRSALVVKGDDQVYTAMAKTVGLPLGLVAKLALENKIQFKGVHLPVMKEVYEPVLAGLENYGIRFTESSKKL